MTGIAAPWPRSSPSWLTNWVVWRIKGAVFSERPTGVPISISLWAWCFLSWCLWRRRGGAYAKRPACAPTPIPQWAWEALKAINASLIVPAPVPKPSSGGVVIAWAQNVIFCAWNPHAGLRAPTKNKLAITADIHVGGDSMTPDQYIANAKGAASQRKQNGGIVAAWGNQSQIGQSQIESFAQTIDADYIIWQAETADEYETFRAAGGQYLIGNSNAWTQAQRDDAKTKIAAGQLAFIFEVYTNEGGPWPDQASSAGVPAASVSPGVGWGATPYHLADYKPHTPDGVWAGISPYIADTFDEQDWALLP